ncbi:hypothetical protein MRY87_11085 [bacterium]|nr:hypothetical protein [bacterium]
MSRSLPLKSLFLLGLFVIGGAVGAWLFVTRPVFFPGRAKSVYSVAPQKLQTHVNYFAERVAGGRRGRREAIRYIYRVFEASGATVLVEKVGDGESPEGESVVAQFGSPGAPLHMVGAPIPAGGRDADRDASGISGLLELATLLKRFPLSNIRVELVAFRGESSLPGETNPYLEALLELKVSPKQILLLHSIGTFMDDSNSQEELFPGAFLLLPSKPNFLLLLGAPSFSSPVYTVKREMQSAVHFPVASLNLPPSLLPLSGVRRAEQFWKADMSAVLVTDTGALRGALSGVVLNYPRMAEVLSAVYQVLRKANSEAA